MPGIEDILPIVGDALKLLKMIIESAQENKKLTRQRGEEILREAKKAIDRRDYNRLHLLIRHVREL